jgi:putative addiction module killer protein
VYFSVYFCIQKKDNIRKKKETELFKKWFLQLADDVSEIVNSNIKRILDGNFSNCQAVGAVVHELKINYQKGYRIYFINKSKTIIILLCGGDKSTQQKDIKTAIWIKKLLKQKGEI